MVNDIMPVLSPPTMLPHPTFLLVALHLQLYFYIRIVVCNILLSSILPLPCKIGVRLRKCYCPTSASEIPKQSGNLNLGLLVWNTKEYTTLAFMVVAVKN